MENAPQRRGLTAWDIWERTGITEHLGGIYATRELLRLCGIKQGQRVLDIGCGTGFTACLLAKEYGADVVGIDFSRKLLRLAEQRAVKEGVTYRVDLIQADAQHLPFKPNIFDAAIAESVLIFCDQQIVASEVYRVLKPGGAFGDNELTYLKPPTKEMSALFSSLILGVHVRPLSEEEWRAVLDAAGFTDVTSTVRGISLWRQLRSHLRIDGVGRYLKSMLVAFTEPSIMAPFLNQDVLRALFQLWSYVGGGLYVARKPQAQAFGKNH